MDALITASARALAKGDALGALKRIALRDDPPALALRGIAMAQLGEHARARALLQRAARGFGAREALSRARCVLAEAEIALAQRALREPPRLLAQALSVIERQGDQANATHARLVAARWHLLLGRLAQAASLLQDVAPRSLPPAQAAVAELAAAQLALRNLRSTTAQQALGRAHQAAMRSGIPALIAEVAQARAVFARPAARRLAGGAAQDLGLAQVEALLASGALVLDACRRGLAQGGAWVALARRPILFALARALAEAWPGDVAREALIAQAFRTRQPDDTHRARLRVEIGRLRALVRPLAGIAATPGGFALRPHAQAEVALLVPPIDGEQAALLALLADGTAWSTSALALALGASQRTVQRAVMALEEAGQVRGLGQARARRWLASPLVDFTTILLLPVALPGA